MAATETSNPISPHHLTDLKRWLKRQDRWHAKCEALRSEEKAGIENGPAFAAWSKGGMPSKASKHHAYGHGSAIARHFNLPRPATVSDLHTIAGHVGR